MQIFAFIVVSHSLKGNRDWSKGPCFVARVGRFAIAAPWFDTRLLGLKTHNEFILLR